MRSESKCMSEQIFCIGDAACASGFESHCLLLPTVTYDGWACTGDPPQLLPGASRAFSYVRIVLLIARTVLLALHSGFSRLVSGDQSAARTKLGPYSPSDSRALSCCLSVCPLFPPSPSL